MFPSLTWRNLSMAQIESQDEHHVWQAAACLALTLVRGTPCLENPCRKYQVCENANAVPIALPGGCAVLLSLLQMRPLFTAPSHAVDGQTVNIARSVQHAVSHHICSLTFAFLCRTTAAHVVMHAGQKQDAYWADAEPALQLRQIRATMDARIPRQIRCC